MWYWNDDDDDDDDGDDDDDDGNGDDDDDDEYQNVGPFKMRVTTCGWMDKYDGWIMRWRDDVDAWSDVIFVLFYFFYCE